MKKSLLTLLTSLTILTGCTTDDREYWKEFPREFYKSLIGQNYRTNVYNNTYISEVDK